MIIYIIPIGIGVAFSGLLLLLWTGLTSVKFIYNPYDSKFNQYIKKRWKSIKIKSRTGLDKKSKIIIFIIAILIAGTGNNIITSTKLFVYGSLIGLIVLTQIYKYQNNIIKAKKLKEAAILFEAAELYTKAGYTLYQALQVAKIMTNRIKPSIDKCLNAWSRGANKALEILQKELNMPESDTLVLLLMHMETAGSKNLEGLLKREAVNIEHLQNIKTKIKISNRPLILMAYRMLPLFSALGLIVGGLLYRTYNVMKEGGVWNF